MREYTRNMPDTVTYWSPGAPDGYGGVAFGAPVTFAARWQSTRELARDDDGEEFVSNATVYVSDPSIERKGWLFEGTSAASDPRTVEGAHEIRQIYQTKNLNGTLRLTKALL